MSKSLLIGFKNQCISPIRNKTKSKIIITKFKINKKLKSKKAKILKTKKKRQKEKIAKLKNYGGANKNGSFSRSWFT